MKDAQKPDHISLNTLINRLKEGRFVIPDFQREFDGHAAPDYIVLDGQQRLTAMYDAFI